MRNVVDRNDPVEQHDHHENQQAECEIVQERIAHGHGLIAGAKSQPTIQTAMKKIKAGTRCFVAPFPILSPRWWGEGKGGQLHGMDLPKGPSFALPPQTGTRSFAAPSRKNRSDYFAAKPNGTSADRHDDLMGVFESFRWQK